MIANMGWGTFLLWGLFDIVIAAGAYLWLGETKGRSLEEIACEGFGKASAVEGFDDLDVERRRRGRGDKGDVVVE